MTRRPPLDPPSVARWTDRFQARFHVAAPETPARPDCEWLSSSGGRFVLFRSRHRSGKSAPKRASPNAPLITSPAADEPRQAHAIIGRGRDGDQGPGTQLPAAPQATQAWLRAHALGIAGCCQIGGCDRVGLAVTRAFLPTMREWRTAASLHGCTPSRAKQSTGSFSDARMWRRRVLAMSIVNQRPLHLVRPRATTTACGLFGPVKRCEAPFACLEPSLLARPSAVQSGHARCEVRRGYMCCTRCCMPFS